MDSNIIKALKTLNLDRYSTIDLIKKTYKDLAKKHHPDINPDDSNLFLEIKSSYEYLIKNFKPEIYLDNTIILGVTLEEVFHGSDIMIKVTRYNPDKTEVNMSIKVPRSIEHGSKLLYRGLGNTINGMTGDLYIKIQILENTFKIDGYDLVYIMDLDYISAQLGCKKTVKTICGKDITIDIPENFNNKSITFEGFGLYLRQPISNIVRGSLVINFNLIPNLSVDNDKLKMLLSSA